MERLTLKAGIHRERARLMAALAPDLMAFDESQAGERLRRYELASGRSLSRALEDLRKHRRSTLSVDSAPSSVVSGLLSVVSGPLSVVSGPLSVVSGPSSVVSGPSSVVSGPSSVVSGPLSVVSGPSSVVSGPLSVVRGETDASARAIAPNEPTDHGENAPNEPTDHWENTLNEPTDLGENAPNEPTDLGENTPNEPTDRRENTPNEPTDRRDNVPNEPTDHCETATIEPTAFSTSHSPLPAQLESYEDALKRIRLRREAVTRQLNEQARSKAADAMAARRSRRREQVAKNRKPVDSPDRPEAHTGRSRMYETVAQQVGDLEELVKASLGL